MVEELVDEFTIINTVSKQLQKLANVVQLEDVVWGFPEVSKGQLLSLLFIFSLVCSPFWRIWMFNL